MQLPPTPYLLLVFCSAESFGEVVSLMGLAQGLRSRWPCVFLGLEAWHPRAQAIGHSGFEAHFLRTPEGRGNPALRRALRQRPPHAIVACDYSQFNIFHRQLPQVASAERLLHQLKRGHQGRVALLDLAGLSLESHTPLRRQFQQVLVPCSGYAKAQKHQGPWPEGVRLFRPTWPKARRLLGAHAGLSAAQAVVFLSYPRPQGWQVHGHDDRLARLWVSAVQAALATLGRQVHVVCFAELAQLLQDPQQASVLPDTASMAQVNAWLARAAVVVTPNRYSTLAARARAQGAEVVVTHNDWPGLSATQRRAALARLQASSPLPPELRAVLRLPELARWLPLEQASCWPGVDVSVAACIDEARSAPLFDTPALATALLGTKAAPVKPAASSRRHVPGPLAALQPWLLSSPESSA